MTVQVQMLPKILYDEKRTQPSESQALIPDLLDLQPGATPKKRQGRHYAIDHEQERVGESIHHCCLLYTSDAADE